MNTNWRIARKRSHLEARARIIQSIRAFFMERDFLEIETPHRIPANAPEPHIDAVPSGEWYLHTSPELCMKRMLAAGYDRLFQICRVWRGNERGSRHLPEFTMLEWYRARSNYEALMEDCEALISSLIPDGRILRGGERIDLSSPWERITVAEAFARHSPIPLEEALASDRFDEILVEKIEPGLGAGPVFLTEYPAGLAALARRKPGDPSVAERFELYIGGLELANAFSELTDADEQRERFGRDEAIRRAEGKIPCPTPEKFLTELVNMPPSAGIALGLDRLIMLLTGAGAIDEVAAFTPEDL